MKSEDKKINEVYNLTYDDKFSKLDLEARHLYLNTDIDECCISDIVYSIIYYNMIDKGVPKEERKPIIIYINSPGGAVLSMVMVLLML